MLQYAASDQDLNYLPLIHQFLDSSSGSKMGLVQSHDEYGKEGIPIFRIIRDFANISFISIERMLSNPVSECSSVFVFLGVGAGVGSIVYS